MESIELLLEQINTVVKRPSATELYMIGLKAAREVFNLVGLELTCDYLHENYNVSQGKIPLPNHIIRVEDAGEPDADKGCAWQVRPGLSLSGRYNFRQQAAGLYFPNLSDGEVRIWFWGFYRDPDTKSLLIPSDCMEACKLLGQYYGLEGDYDHPGYRERENLALKARNETFMARSNMNRTSIAQKRTDRRLL